MAVCTLVLWSRHAQRPRLAAISQSGASGNSGTMGCLKHGYADPFQALSMSSLWALT